MTGTNGQTRQKAGMMDLVNGAVLSCMEAGTLGLPFEVWKTRMGRHREESTVQAFKNVYRSGGIATFWSGFWPKMVEAGSKGAILLYSKEIILDACHGAGASEGLSGFIAGAGGGVCQTSVMGPCTFLVTAAVNGDKSISTSQRISNVYRLQGIKGFYPGGTAVAFRQATNWASRQGFTEVVRKRIKLMLHGDKDARLSVSQEIFSAFIGGTLSCWNQPFEVARIQMQSAADQGEPKQNMVQVFKMIIKERGPAGLFKGVIPRIGLAVWQTIFMVTVPIIYKSAQDVTHKK